MARTSDQITEQEIQAFNEFCQQHAVVTEGEIGEQNAKHISEYIVDTWKQDISAATLTVALEKLGDRLVFKSAIQVELEQVVSKLNDQERRVAYNWFKRQRLVSDGDQGSENVTNIIGWLQRNNHPITDQTLNLALSNIVNSGKRPLHWKPAPLQDAEKEQQRQREASRAPVRQERAEAVPAHPELALAPHLKAHQEMLHRPSEAVKVTRQDSDAEWRVRAESVTTNSHLDRAQLAKLFVKQQSNPTEIDWQGTHRARLLFLERRNHARTQAGR